MLLSFQSLCARPRTGCTQSPRRRTVLSKEGSLSFKPPALPTNHVTKTTFPVATNGVTPVNTRRSWLSLGILSASVWTVARPAPSYASDDTASQEDIEMDEATKLELVGFTDPSYGFSLLRPRGWDVEKKPGSKFYCADPAVIFGINRCECLHFWGLFCASSLLLCDGSLPWEQ